MFVTALQVLGKRNETYALSMSVFDDTLTLRQARGQFFAANEAVFGKDGGYDKKWVRIQLGAVPIFLPNMAGRDRAVRLHDLHHIVTGYSTELVGEAEIGAWEVGSGCGNFWHAWVLNLWAFALGLLIAPRRTFSAFVRGRHSENLYHTHSQLGETLLDETVGAMRKRLQLNQQVVPRARDYVAFFVWSAVSLLVTSPVLIPLIIVLVVIVLLL
jgi:hypothetical protein